MPDPRLTRFDMAWRALEHDDLEAAGPVFRELRDQGLAIAEIGLAWVEFHGDDPAAIREVYHHGGQAGDAECWLDLAFSLRDGQDRFPGARADLGTLLWQTAPRSRARGRDHMPIRARVPGRARGETTAHVGPATVVIPTERWDEFRAGRWPPQDE